MPSSRLEKTIRNAKISLIFLVAVLLATFLSRAIFIKGIGADFVGLSTTMMNIMGFLNLAEMGFGSVVAFALYKPIHDDNKQEIGEVASVFAYIYWKIGYVVLGVGLLIAVVLPYAFRSTGFSSTIIYATYFTYLSTTLMGFFLNYREVVLVADQKNYVKVAITNGLKLAKLGLQSLAVLYLSQKILSWLFLEFLALALYAKVLNVKINQIYPWLQASRKVGREVSKKYGIIYQKSKQAFAHKFATLVLQQTGAIFVFAFANLSTVTKYTNYTIILSALVLIISALFDSTNAGVGNLVASKNKERISKVFWELQASRFWISGVFAYTTYSSIDAFISAWVGPSYHLSRVIVIVLVINFLLTIARKTTDEFLGAYGFYHDTWAPITEAVINIGVVLIAGKYLGVLGIALGTLVSIVLIVGIWKPIFLFRDAFEISPYRYFVNVSGYALILVVSFACTSIIPQFVIVDNKFGTFLSLAMQNLVIFGAVSFALFVMFSKGMRDFTSRFYRHFF